MPEKKSVKRPVQRKPLTKLERLTKELKVLKSDKAQEHLDSFECSFPPALAIKTVKEQIRVLKEKLEEEDA